MCDRVNEWNKEVGSQGNEKAREGGEMMNECEGAGLG